MDLVRLQELVKLPTGTTPISGWLLAQLSEVQISIVRRRRDSRYMIGQDWAEARA